MVAIVAEGIGVTLGGRNAVRNVSLRLDARQLVGVLGPNGAGKSSLIRALLGLIPHSGRVAVDDEALGRAALARRVAYLPQGQTLHWPLSVERLVALGRLPHLAPLSRLSRADAEAVDHAMARTRIAHLAGRITTELSGGESARVLLARALAVEAPALVADEPLASLDPAHQIEAMEILRGEADSGALVVAVLHDLTLAARYCDRVIVLCDGEVAADGAPMDVLTPELLARVYGITAFYGDATHPMLVPLGRVNEGSNHA